MIKSRKYLILIIILAFSVAGIFFFKSKNKPAAPSLPIATPYSGADTATPPTSNQNTKPDNTNNAENPTTTLPEQVNLKIPFTSQAPHQNWEDPYGEFCEEASALMVVSYIQNQPILSADDADKKLLAIKDFEEKKFGFHLDTTAEQTAIILREHFNLTKVELVENPTSLDIKTALADGKAVILPLAGRELGNPYYQQPGPLYHMLVVKGYTKNGSFITNDPGTKRGADYIYTESVLMNALHDWNDGDVYNGKKVMIIVG